MAKWKVTVEGRPDKTMRSENAKFEYLTVVAADPGDATVAVVYEDENGHWRLYEHVTLADLAPRER